MASILFLYPVMMFIYKPKHLFAIIWYLWNSIQLPRH